MRFLARRYDWRTIVNNFVDGFTERSNHRLGVPSKLSAHKETARLDVPRAVCTTVIIDLNFMCKIRVLKQLVQKTTTVHTDTSVSVIHTINQKIEI